MGMTAEEAGLLAKLYRKQLQEIMEEWSEHTIDEEEGGYLTDFGEDWRLVSRRKFIWAQARQTYQFAAYSENSGDPQRWLALARRGRSFLMKHAYAGEGRWYYEVSQDGREVREGTTTIFTDLFALAALSQYAAASKDLADLSVIRETFEAVRRNVPDKGFRDIRPHVFKEGVRRHSVFMIAIHSAMMAERVLGKEVTRPFIRECMNRLLFFFGENKSGYLLESLLEDGGVWDSQEGRIVNPGHIFEGMWFCIDYARSRNKEAVIERGVEVIEHTARVAVDQEYGGVIYRFDCFGKEENAFAADTGELRADDKVDWVNCESLYAFLLAAVWRGDEGSAKRFYRQHQFCQEHFRPREGGDWYPVLKRDGTPIRKNKGGRHRAAFHVPRALMNVSLLLDRVEMGKELYNKLRGD